MLTSELITMLSDSITYLGDRPVLLASSNKDGTSSLDEMSGYFTLNGHAVQLMTKEFEQKLTDSK